VTDPVTEFVLQEPTERVQAYVAGLIAGRITLASTAARLRLELVLGPRTLERIRALAAHWQSIAGAGTEGLLGVVIEGQLSVRDLVVAKAPVCELVWTGDQPAGSRVRSTLPVMEEMIGRAQETILVVSYALWLGQEAGSLVDQLAMRSSAGVTVSFVLDARYEGGHNITALRKRWPRGRRPPTVYSWQALDHSIAKLHAKVLVVDQQDVLISSANLTSHAMARNLELGLRVRGQPAAEAARHFDTLIRKGVFDAVPW
jgi:phosphatidylserine/phosphatidylglycerophosphate/cardiolipin synthase-like enzyme